MSIPLRYHYAILPLMNDDVVGVGGLPAQVEQVGVRRCRQCQVTDSTSGILVSDPHSTHCDVIRWERFLRRCRLGQL